MDIYAEVHAILVLKTEDPLCYTLEHIYITSMHIHIYAKIDPAT
jgi:hypothetical protein